MNRSNSNESLASPTKRSKILSLFKQNSKSYDGNDPTNKVDNPSPALKTIKKSQKIQARDIKDLDANDSDGRNILHRACVEQNRENIRDIIQDYEICLKHPSLIGNKQISETELDYKIKQYVNKPDNYGNSPLLNACVQNYDKSPGDRYHIIEFLLSKGADPTIRNKRTKWTAINWLSYFGDEKSIEFLLTKDIDLHIPDYEGFYPIDLAGKNVNFLINSEKIWNNNQASWEIY